MRRLLGLRDMGMQKMIFLGVVLAAMPAMAQQDSNSGGGVFAPGGHDTDQPIEITSDLLEVEQEKQVAIFIGNVDAIQGDMTLNSDRLEVFYNVEESEGEGEGEAQAEDDGQTESIRSLRAEGNVVVKSPSETAKGDWADYDVVARILTLHDNVVLNQGRNVLCGSKLDMDLNPGRSLLKGKCARSASNPKGRVQGVFFPSKSKD